MNNQNAQLRTDMGHGMALGVALMTVAAILVTWLTGNEAIWSWSAPVGVAIGAAIGGGRNLSRPH